MSENFISITSLNDFVFCPASIYFHLVEGSGENLLTQEVVQINGTSAHRTIDTQTYSTSRYILQGVPVCSIEYGLFGKIDTFNTKTGELVERKKQIKRIYDGYIFQLYAQYYCLIEMGYVVNKLSLHSLDDNKSYNVKLPYDDHEKQDNFTKLIEKIRSFDFEGFSQDNNEKCTNCIYEPLCSFSCIASEVL